MSDSRLVLDLFLIGGVVYVMWGARRTRTRVAGLGALVQQYATALSEPSRLLTTVLDRSIEQRQQIAALEDESNRRT